MGRTFSSKELFQKQYNFIYVLYYTLFYIFFIICIFVYYVFCIFVYYLMMLFPDLFEELFPELFQGLFLETRRHQWSPKPGATKGPRFCGHVFNANTDMHMRI